MPDLRPMLATRGDHVPTGVEWLHEVKWDGMRVLAHLDGAGGLRLESRAGNVVTAAYPELAGLVDATAGRAAVLDGEVVAMVDGRPSFSVLAERIHERKPARAAALAAARPVTFVAFDLLALDGREVVERPLERRRRRLEGVLEVGGEGDHWLVPPTYADGPGLLDATREQGLEGIVSKRRGTAYRPGLRSRDWLKFPHRRRDSYVIGGWRPETGGRERIGAVLVGVPTPAGLLYRGRVGSGIGGRVGPGLQAALEPLARSTSPFADEVPRIDAAGTHWVEPTLVVDVEALGINGDPAASGARLRQPAYRGLRSDVTPDDLLPDDALPGAGA
ncbi:non-homologous end-joining DNA ligase [Nocardioides zeae]|uniref:DNA ligase (ATP) n=1 Tax=Nocardioides imazamoxiresistens TaxID=3231893 RepID=A0ABU3PQM7_9ACTN|nr:non-homologous end-joining DNA ligase [Nocardioides zeae]MDT9591520.1 non-homologous end-joining DNA ligase [Nocardioides zeae]